VKVTKDKVEKGQAFLTVETEPAEVEKSLSEAYKHLVQRVNVPGFRKGKAPRPILERYVGRQNFLSEAIEHLIPEAYEKALKEASIEAIAQPQIEVIQTEPTVTFKATVPLLPVVKLGDYKSIRITPEPVTVTDEQVNQAIEVLRHQHAIWEPVERPVQFNDLVILDIESHIGNAPFINQKGLQYHVAEDRTFPAPGFAAQITGMKKGEEKEFKLTFPKDYPRAELADKETSFKVKVGEIKQEVLPELNDDFAKVVNPEFATFAVLKQKVAESLKERAEEKARAEFEDKVITEVTRIAQVEFPPVLVEREMQRMLEEESRRFQMQGADFGEYLKSTRKTGEQLRQELEPVAIKRLMQSLVLSKVAEEEKVDVSDAEIDNEIENMLKGVSEKKEELQKAFNNPNSRESIKRMLLTRKTVNLLVEIARSPVSESPASPQAEPKKNKEKKKTAKTEGNKEGEHDEQ